MIYKKLLLLIFIIPFVCRAQFPSYPVVLKTFFSSYSYHPDDPVQILNFAKKKDGWYVQVMNRSTEKVQEEQLFWSVDRQAFHLINGMSAALSQDEAELQTDAYINGQASLYNFYGYERCRYYGYDAWAIDMIRDFGTGNFRSYSDTLLEGIGRAYSAHSSHFLWYQQGGYQNQDEALRKKLLPLERPSPRRMDSVVVNINKGLGAFRLLAEKFPEYKTLVGNSGMKVFNEQMNGYMQMAMSGYEERAKDFIRNIVPNRTITQMAKNYLGSCPPNAILFTFGDNDTYPLWYVQQRDQYRKDVTVLNTNLLGFAPYVDMVRRKSLVRFKTGPQYYGDTSFTYFVAMEKGNQVMDAKTFMEVLLRKQPAASEPYYGVYPTKKIRIPVDPERFSHLSGQPGLKNEINIELGKYFLTDQFIILDIILSNLYERPVLFSGTPDLYTKYLQKEGLNYRLLPLNTEKTKDNDKMSRTRTEKILHETIRAVPSNDYHTGIAPEINSDAHLFDLYIDLLVNSDSKEKSHALIAKLMEQYHHNFPITRNAGMLGILMIGSGYEETGTKLLEDYANQVYHDYLVPDSSGGYISKSMAENLLLKLKESLEGMHIKNAIVENLLNQLK